MLLFFALVSTVLLNECLSYNQDLFLCFQAQSAAGTCVLDVLVRVSIAVATRAETAVHGGDAVRSADSTSVLDRFVVRARGWTLEDLSTARGSLAAMSAGD